MTPAELIDLTAVPKDLPLVVAACGPTGAVAAVASGTWQTGQPVDADDLFYVASLAKQVTGAAAALLVREARLDPDLPISRYVGGLPDWARHVSSRHLLNHTSGLPGSGTEPPGVDWTEELAFEQIRQARLATAPGSEQSYSNLGYVLLAEVIAGAASMPFARWVEQRLFAPLGLTGMRFADSGVEGFHAASLLGPGLPLTLGDGGLWSGVVDFCRWLHLQNTDALGIGDLVTQPARLPGGRAGDYGWGIGLRVRDGQPLYIHGGQWGGAVAKAVRSPSRGTAACAMAAGLSIDEVNAIVDRALAIAEA